MGQDQHCALVLKKSVNVTGPFYVRLTGAVDTKWIIQPTTTTTTTTTTTAAPTTTTTTTLATTTCSNTKIVNDPLYGLCFTTESTTTATTTVKSVGIRTLDGSSFGLGQTAVALLVLIVQY